MKKRKTKAVARFMIMAGEATPAPPVGTSLGQQGASPMEFCRDFNERSKDRKGDLIPVVVSIYRDSSFDFIMKKCPTTFLLKKAAGIIKGSADPSKMKVATIKREEIRKIAEYKLDELNTDDIEIAMKTIKGTADSMGLLIEG